MKILLCCFIISAIIVSCSKGSSSSSFPFEGDWSGSYDGAQDNGSWEIHISSTGTVTGTAISVVFTDTYQVTGTVSSNGNFNAVTSGSVTSGSVFIGKLTETHGSGTWVNTGAGMNGTWSGDKQ